MKFVLAATILAALAFVPVAGAAAASTPAAAPVAPAEPVPPPKSVFLIDPATVKDPFYPKSKRWADILPKTNAAPVIEQPLFPDELQFKGVSGTAEKRLAIVNNKTVEKGEKWDFLLKTGQRVQVQCIDVKEKTVTLEVNGITRELHLRASLQ